MINVAKLKNVVQKDGKIEAQCPACASAGADSKGNHLVVFPDGKYGCVANPDDEAHRKLIHKLVGERGGVAAPQLAIRRLVIPESTVLLKIGRLGREKATPVETVSAIPQDALGSTDVDESRPVGPDAESEKGKDDKEDPYSSEAVRRFLAS